MELLKPILIADDMHAVLMNGLQDAHISFDYRPDISVDELKEVIPEYEMLIVRSKIRVDRDLIDRASSLKCIARAGAGMDNIDEAYAKSRGIVCLNAPEGNRDAVGEHALGMLLNLTRNIGRSYKEVQEGKWLREENRGEELTELTVGIIGFGNTGQSFAQKISGFGCQVLYFDKFIPSVPTHFARPALLEEVYDQADVLSFHIPLDESNKGLINRDLIETVTRPFYLLNLSRGGIMNTKDILWGLENGKIKGAGLDVLENETLVHWTEDEKRMFDSLVKTNRVVVTPHIGGWTRASYRKISEVLLNKIMSMLA
ncbi:MAG: phosphoglycerate dehydrogenase [Bacteroidetes bacterium]|nr:phosphoglycerate dehydrogenase [Bacteroidota bacterium]